MAGYSARTLVEKLGIKPGAIVRIINEPDGFSSTLGPLPAGTQVCASARQKADFIHFFTKQRRELESKLPGLKNGMIEDGMIWVSWPKGASKIPTDLNENVVREIALANGLVDVKVCAVDEVWSGLKLVIRLKDRKQSAARRGKNDCR